MTTETTETTTEETTENPLTEETTEETTETTEDKETTEETTEDDEETTEDDEDDEEIRPLTETRPRTFETKLHESFDPDGRPKTYRKIMTRTTWFDRPIKTRTIEIRHNPGYDGPGEREFYQTTTEIIGITFRTFKGKNTKDRPYGITLGGEKKGISDRLPEDHQTDEGYLRIIELSGTIGRTLSNGKKIRGGTFDLPDLLRLSTLD